MDSKARRALRAKSYLSGPTDRGAFGGVPRGKAPWSSFVTAAHVPLLAALHRAAFGAEAWSEMSLATLLGTPFTFGLVQEGGFILARAVAGEAEILTLAVAPEQQRQGIGRALLGAALGEALRRGASRVFLEVGEDNKAAITLYTGAGFTEAALRREYYGPRRAALLLSRALPSGC